MRQLTILSILLLVFCDDHSAALDDDLFGQSSGRIRNPSGKFDVLSYTSTNSAKQLLREQYKRARAREISPTFVQSRHFHRDQQLRDNRDLRQPYSYNSPSFSSYYYSYEGPGTQMGGTLNQEGCRLTTSSCSHDYHCCSGKCRCVRWSISGKMSCWKKCF